MSSAPRRMADWSSWEGKVAGGEFPLERYLGGSEKSAIFLTRVRSVKVAIKLVPAGHAQASELASRWNRAAMLAHPHVVRIFKAGTCQMGDMSLAYLVMEYAEEDLAAVLAERTLSVDETREMVQPIADALAYLHGRGLVHGRLKPSNIFAVKDTVKVSCDSVSAGDPATDVSALATTMMRALMQGPAAISLDARAIDALPQPLQEVARNCLCAEPRLRWSSADIASWLRSWQPSSAANPVPAARVSRPATNPRLGYYLAAFVLILLATVTVWRLEIRRTAAPTPSASTPAPVSTPAPPAPAEQTAPQAVSPIPPAREPQPSPDIPTREGIVRQVIPDIPVKARNTVHGTVRVVVRVVVDPSGNVTDATVERSVSRYFSRLSLAAARRWQFVPTPGAASREWVLRFEIRQTGTNVVSKESSAR